MVAGVKLRDTATEVYIWPSAVVGFGFVPCVWKSWGGSTMFLGSFTISTPVLVKGKKLWQEAGK